MRHFQRLHLAASRMASGASADDALRALRPPVFFKQQERFKAQLSTWPAPRAAAALNGLTQAELNSKRAVLPQETILREALFSIAHTARRADRPAAERSSI
jgi:DNA polymerase-3 subunit delta